MSQQQVDAYRQQLLASYYQQQQQQQQQHLLASYYQQQQQQRQRQQQLSNTPTYYYNMPNSSAEEAAYSPSPSTMALLSGLQQQHQQDQQQRQLAIASPTPSHLTARYSPPPAHQHTVPETPSFLQEQDYQREATTPSPARGKSKATGLDAAPSKEHKLKKKKSFLARIAEKNKNLGPKDPSFWSPRDGAQAKRFGRGGLKGTEQSQKIMKANPASATAAEAGPPPVQYQQEASTPPVPAPPSIPVPPFALPQIPSGGYLYYCPPTTQLAPTPAPAAIPAPETTGAQKPVYRINATAYNPRQGNPGDRCTIM